jgi:hypothetical protein
VTVYDPGVRVTVATEYTNPPAPPPPFPSLGAEPFPPPPPPATNNTVTALAPAATVKIPELRNVCKLSPLTDVSVPPDAENCPTPNQAFDVGSQYSMYPVVVFLRIIPFVGLAGRCAVVPVGMTIAPVPLKFI